MSPLRVVHPLTGQETEEYGPPHDKRKERELLWRITCDAKLRKTVLQTFGASDFYVLEHAQVFDAIFQLHVENPEAEIDGIQIADKLLSDDARDIAISPPLVMSWVDDVDRLVPDLKKLTFARKIWETNMKLARDAVDPSVKFSPDEFIDHALAKMGEVIRSRDSKSVASSIREGFEEHIQRLINRAETTPALKLPVPLECIKPFVRSLEAGRLYIIAGRPSMGKSSIAVQTAWHIACMGHRARFYSLEMSKEELTDKIIAAMTGIDTTTVNEQNYSGPQFDAVTKMMSTMQSNQFDMVRAARLTLEDILADARFEHARRPMQLIVIDYLQLMKTRAKFSEENKQAQVAYMSRELKLIALELGIPVIAVAQLNRDLEKRQDKRPQMADLRDSGSIEQDADVIMFVYREGKYNPSVDERNAEIILSKNRSGPTGIGYCHYQPHLTWFKDSN